MKYLRRFLMLMIFVMTLCIYMGLPKISYSGDFNEGVSAICSGLWGFIIGYHAYVYSEQFSKWFKSNIIEK